VTLEELAQSVAALPSEQYKKLLGEMLGRGLQDNEFEYPQGSWPPPTPARAYIRAFLEHYVDKIRGRCVEFDPPVYQSWLSANAAVTSYDVWDTAPSPRATVVADLQQADNLADGAFDTIICTHVLSAIRDVWRAAAELHRLLAPGGMLLCTVPSILQKYAPHPKDYWRFTEDSMVELLADFSRFELYSLGNAATVAGSPYFLMVDHFPQWVLDTQDPSCPSIIAVAAWR
jgi:SAM-dependent methyltransferase